MRAAMLGCEVVQRLANLQAVLLEEGSGIVHCVCMCGIVDAFRQATS